MPYIAGMRTHIEAQEAIDKAQGITALAKVLGVKRQAVQQYRKNGIPPERILQLMRDRPEWFKDQRKPTESRKP